MSDDVLNDTCNTYLHEPEKCGYLPDRKRRDLRLAYKEGVDDIDKLQLAEILFEAGMNYDGGKSLFSNMCDDCAACVPIRYPVADFRPSDTQRDLKRLLPLPNIEFSYGFKSKAHLREHWAMYARYRHARFPHEKIMKPLRRMIAPFASKMGTPINVMEVRTIDYVLLGAAINAETENSYFGIFYYYDPAMMHLQPGKQIVMLLLEEARKRGKSHVYVGPWNAESNALSVKTQYRPYELYIGREWQRFDTPHPKLGKLTP